VALAACSTGNKSEPESEESDAAEASASAAAVDPIPTASASAIVSAAPPGPLAGSAIKRDIEWLAAPERRGRGSGTKDETVAREWIVAALKDIGLEPEVTPFKFAGARTSANVMVTIAPETPDKKAAVLLGGHYDHVGVRDGKVYPGADDNGSGTAIILAMTRVLVTKRAEIHRPIIVVFFGAEETGLDGSEAFVRSWRFGDRPIHTMVNVDMVGRPLLDQPQLWLAAKLMGILPDIEQDRGIALVLPDEPGDLGVIARAACAEEGVQVVTVDDLPQKYRKQVDYMSRGRSDHWGFQKKNIPFLFFSSAESTDYHAPTDTPDKIKPEIVERRARAFLRTVLKLAE
jgi:Zn-dependent M28 family amino/carboxypeptidase